MAAASNSRVSGVDGMRAIAALSVFFCHLAAYWGLQGRLPGKITQITELGAHGVDLFVVISGFCLGLPVARAVGALNLRKFFIRRGCRIVPPYYAALAICATLAVLPATSHFVVERPAGAGTIVAHFLFLQSLIPGQIGTINGSFWSIALEVQLYVLFPVVVLAWRRIGIGWIVGLTGILSIAWTASGHMHWWILGSDNVLPDRLVQFTVGVLAASLFASGRIPARPVLWGGLVVGGLTAATASTAGIELGNAILWSVPSACAVLLAGQGFTHSFAGKFLARFGLASYSFYLLQQPVLLLTSPIAHRVTTSPAGLLALGSTGCLALVGIAAWLMFLYVEAPSVRLGARVVSGMHGTGPSSATRRHDSVSDPDKNVDQPVSRAAVPSLGTGVGGIGDQWTP